MLKRGNGRQEEWGKPESLIAITEALYQYYNDLLLKIIKLFYCLSYYYSGFLLHDAKSTPDSICKEFSL